MKVLFENLGVFIALCVVLTSRCSSCQYNGSDHTKERWIWGYDNENESSDEVNGFIPPVQLKSAANTNLEEDDYDKNYAKYCGVQDTKMPNFTAQGKRLAQAKCEEHIWKIRNEYEIAYNRMKCLYYTPQSDATQHGSQHTIFSGYNALYDEFPHMVALGYIADNGTLVHLCGGSLISSNYVLTAAHCIFVPYLRIPTPKVVIVGQVDLITIPDFDLANYSNHFDGIIFTIKRIIPHPLYDSPIKYYDIALLELEEHVPFTKSVQPACLWHNDDLTELGPEVTVTGWGITEYTNHPTVILQVGSVNVISSRLCNDLLDFKCSRNWCGIKENQVCAGNLEGGADACQGDSGGPLQVPIDLGFPPLDNNVKDFLTYLNLFEEPLTVKMYHVFGVTSFGVGCGVKGRPGVYTRVSSFLDWIEDVVWK